MSYQINNIVQLARGGKATVLYSIQKKRKEESAIFVDVDYTSHFKIQKEVTTTT